MVHTGGVFTSIPYIKMPVIFIKPIVIGLVNLRVLPPAQPYEAEGIAVVQPPIQKDEPNEWPCQPVRNRY